MIAKNLPATPESLRKIANSVTRGLHQRAIVEDDNMVVLKSSRWHVATLFKIAGISWIEVSPRFSKYVRRLK